MSNPTRLVGHQPVLIINNRDLDCIFPLVVGEVLVSTTTRGQYKAKMNIDQVVSSYQRSNLIEKRNACYIKR